MYSIFREVKHKVGTLMEDTSLSNEVIEEIGGLDPFIVMGLRSGFIEVDDLNLQQVRKLDAFYDKYYDYLNTNEEYFEMMSGAYGHYEFNGKEYAALEAWRIVYFDEVVTLDVIDKEAQQHVVVWKLRKEWQELEDEEEIADWNSPMAIERQVVFYGHVLRRAAEKLQDRGFETKLQFTPKQEFLEDIFPQWKRKEWTAADRMLKHLLQHYEEKDLVVYRLDQGYLKIYYMDDDEMFDDLYNELIQHL